MITPNEAAAVMNVSSRTIYRWIEGGGLHFTEESGTLLVCMASLPALDRGSFTKVT
jgi:excisionase family DNA binding protein